MKWLMEPVAVAFAVVVVLAMIILLGGVYLRTTQPEPTPTPTPWETMAVTEIPTPEPTPLPETAPPTPEVTTPAPAPTQRGTYAESAIPIRDPKIYNAPDYTTFYNPKGRVFPTIFHKSYDMDFQYEAIYAEVNNPPFIIDFSVAPESSSPIQSFFIITVRDNTTKKVISQDGFFRTYSAESPKRLYFSFPGKFHVDLYGGFTNVDLTLRAPV